MRVGILSDGPDLSSYLAEMFNTWGLVLYEVVEPDRILELDPKDVPVLVCPASQSSRSLVDFARRGGTVICFLPEGPLAEAAGLVYEGEKDVPLRLRVTAYPAAGMAGERFPIVGHANNYSPAPGVQVLGYFSYTDRYEGESVGITETTVGQGRIVGFAFDLALCVLLLRQGDPNRAEVVPEGTGCARPSSMAIDTGPPDSGWVPFADLLSRLLVDTVRRYLPGPVPLLSHLPGTAPGILLYSGDEDNADVASNDAEFECVAAAGGRMNLYIIPNRTQSAVPDVERYRVQHDVGPHPDLRPLDGCSVSERLTEFERQIRMFQDRFDTPARSLRNHCTAWAGYLEPVEVMEKLGVGMDGNYFSGTYGYSREDAPYAAFGGAMPMRFCWPDGRVLNVFQQHTQLADDIMFGTADYSYRLSPQVFAGVLDRIFTDIETRFHTPYGVCIHPGNWVRFSRPQGRELLRQANERRFPIWSFDQWLGFWEARDTWRFNGMTRQGCRLQFALEGERSHGALWLAIPAKDSKTSLVEIKLDGECAEWQTVQRYGEDLALVPIPAGKTAISVSVMYGSV
ncbi:MAG: hypothetical protein F4Y79_01160 [Gemmatimonadetes bacterium]|nr:hypothetical protein [Gemmatimonadota bacterium]